MTNTIEFIDEPDTIHNETIDNGLLVTNNQTTKPINYRETKVLLTGFLCEYQNILLSRGINASEAVCKQNELIDEYAERIEQAIAATLGSDDEYEAKMDALLCRLTNGKWSKSRAYSLDFMVSCVDEEYEDAYEKERAELGSGTCDWIPLYSWLWECSNCGEIYYRDDAWKYKYCPLCGTKCSGNVQKTADE